MKLITDAWHGMHAHARARMQSSRDAATLPSTYHSSIHPESEYSNDCSITANLLRASTAPYNNSPKRLWPLMHHPPTQSRHKASNGRGGEAQLLGSHMVVVVQAVPE